MIKSPSGTSSLARRLLRLDAWTATAWYVAITLAMTWPLAAGLARRLPLDLGDPLLNCWILQWDADRLLRFLRGDLGALRGFWNANIFYPEPLALAYSEHLLAQAVQVLPLYALTHNIVLAYNVLFLSTFVLSGLGVFLLVRELTGSARAAFLAGLFYAFAPYRLSQLGHLQVLSSQWMPFALYGFTRWGQVFNRARSGVSRPGPVVPLSGAAAALVAQNLSCGYFLLYFSPFAAVYALWQVAVHGLWRERRAWWQLATAGFFVVLLTLPFLLPYMELRTRGFSPRPLSEVLQYSADPTTYFRATDGLWLWPGGFVDPISTEAVLFPGFTPLALALVALACLAVGLRRRTLGAAPLRGWRLAAAVPTALVGVAALDLARFELFAGRHIWRVRDAWPFLADIRHVLAIVAVAALALLVLSPRARAAARLALTSGRAFFTAACLASVWLSFGPQITTRQHGLSGPTIYAWLYHHVPGFDGLRVPARFGMLAMLFLAVVAGYGASALAGTARRERRLVADGTGQPAEPTAEPGSGLRDSVPQGSGIRLARTILLCAVGVFFLVEATGAPIDVASIEWGRGDGHPGVVSAADLEPVYAFIRRMPKGTVVAEFPFGNLHGETRAVFLSTRHRHPILNGYSGGFPAGYDRRKDLLQNPVATGEAAWQALVTSGVTCVVVHEWAFDGGNGRMLSQWLTDHGALPLATFRSDRIFSIGPGQ